MYNHKSRAKKMVVMGIGGFFLFVFLAFILGFFIMILWNWLMPIIFGLPEITYWQAWGLFLFTKLLFGTGKHHRYHCHSGKRNERRQKMKAKFKKWLDTEEDEIKQNSSNQNTE